MQVFHTSPWVPPEWIKAHGLEPRGVWCAPDFALAAAPLAAGVCAFAQAAVSLAETQADSAVVFTTHCDQLRRGFDVVAGSAPGRVFLFNLPATWQTTAGQRLYVSELERLSRFLVELGGHPPGKEGLSGILGQYSLARRRLLEAASSCPARAYAEAVARFYWDGSLPADAHAGGPGPATASPRFVPLALVGGPLPRSQWGLLDTIENAGGRVVLNATEAGERTLVTADDLALAESTAGRDGGRGLGAGGREASVRPIGALRVGPQENETRVPGPSSQAGRPDDEVADLRESLARRFVDGCVDVFQRPNTRLYSWLKERLSARGARGIILWHYVGCDLWRAEAQSLREAFRLPLLLLEAEEAQANSPRNTGRIQAFLETLR